MAVVVRRAVPEDHPHIVGANVAMAKETEGIELNADVTGRGVRNLLSSPEKGFYVVALVDGVFAGSLMITTEWSDWRDGYYWWIQSVYILPEYRSRGIFRQLYSYVDSTARAEGNVSQLRLYVEKTNTNAQSVYSKLGMSPSHYLMYESIIRE